MTSAPVSLNDIQRMLAAQHAEMNGVKTKLSDLEKRIQEEYGEVVKRLDTLQQAPGLPELRKELEVRHKSYLTEISTLQTQINALLGTGAHLSDIQTNGKRPLWTYMAQALLAEGPSSPEQIAVIVRRMGYKFDAVSPGQSCRQTMEAYPSYFQKVKGTSPVIFEVISENLPKPGETPMSWGQKSPATKPGPTPPTVAGKPIPSHPARPVASMAGSTK
jgi:hypothetical protein